MRNSINSKKRMKSFFLSLRFLFLCSLIEKLFFSVPFFLLISKNTQKIEFHFVKRDPDWKGIYFSFIFFTSHNFHLIFFLFFLEPKPKRRKLLENKKIFLVKRKIFRFSLSGTRRLTESCFFISSFCML